MKRRRSSDELKPWEDPNKLNMPALRDTLTMFGVDYDQTANRGRLFQQYVELARVESPDSVEVWTGQESLGGPLPGADRLLLSQLKIFLALHATEFPPYASRGHLVKLYGILRAKHVKQIHSAVKVLRPKPTYLYPKQRKLNQNHQKNVAVSTSNSKETSSLKPGCAGNRKFTHVDNKDRRFLPHKKPSQGRVTKKNRLSASLTPRQSMRLRNRMSTSVNPKSRCSPWPTGRAVPQPQESESKEAASSRGNAIVDNGDTSFGQASIVDHEAASSRGTSIFNNETNLLGDTSTVNNEPDSSRRTSITSLVDEEAGASREPSVAQEEPAGSSRETSIVLEEVVSSQATSAQTDSSSQIQELLGEVISRDTSCALDNTSIPRRTNTSHPNQDLPNDAAAFSHETSDPGNQETSEETIEPTNYSLDLGPCSAASSAPAEHTLYETVEEASEPSESPGEGISQAVSASSEVLNFGEVESTQHSVSPRCIDSSSPPASNLVQSTSIFPGSTLFRPAKLKRKFDDPSNWPDVSTLSRAELEAFLAAHNVAHDRNAPMGRLISSYHILRSKLSGLHGAKRLSKRRRTPSSSNIKASHSGRPRLPTSSKALSSSRQLRPRKQKSYRIASSSSEVEDPGFVYQRPESLDINPTSQSVASSNFELPTSVTETSLSAPSTRRSSRNLSTLRAQSNKRNHPDDDYSLSSVRQPRSKPADSRMPARQFKSLNRRPRRRSRLIRNSYVVRPSFFDDDQPSNIHQCSILSTTPVTNPPPNDSDDHPLRNLNHMLPVDSFDPPL